MNIADKVGIVIASCGTRGQLLTALTYARLAYNREAKKLSPWNSPGINHIASINLFRISRCQTEAWHIYNKIGEEEEWD